MAKAMEGVCLPTPSFPVPNGPLHIRAADTVFHLDAAHIYTTKLCSYQRPRGRRVHGEHPPLFPHVCRGCATKLRRAEASAANALATELGSLMVKQMEAHKSLDAGTGAFIV